MANITCPQCKRFVDETTKFCPGCKFNIKKHVKEMKKKGMTVGSSLSLNGIYAHKSEPAKFTPELDFLKGANNSVSQLDFAKNETPAAPIPSINGAAPAAATNEVPELDFLKNKTAAPQAQAPMQQAPAAQPMQSAPAAAKVDMFAPPIPQAPANRTNVSAMSPADVFSEKPVAPRQVIAPAPSAPAMSQAAAMAAYQEKREAAAAQAQAQAYANAAAQAQAQAAQQTQTAQVSQAAQMAAYQEKREAVQQRSFTAPTQPMASAPASRPIGSPMIQQQTIQPVFESASLNQGVLNGGGALSGVLSGPTIMEKIAQEKKLAKENESIFESASLRKAEKEIKAGTRQAAGGLHGDIPLDQYRDNGVKRFGEASEYQRQMAALGQGAAGGASVPPYAKQPPYAAQQPQQQPAPYAVPQQPAPYAAPQQQVPAATAAPGGLNPMFAAPQSNNPLFGGGAPQAAQSPYGQTAPNGLLAQPQASANPLFGSAPAANPMLAGQPAAPAAGYQPVQQAAPSGIPAAAYQPVQQAAPTGYQPVQQAGVPAGVYTGAPAGGMFGSQPAAPAGAMFGTQPAAQQAPVQPVGNPYGA